MEKRALAERWRRRAARLLQDAAGEVDEKGRAAMEYGAMIYGNCAEEVLRDEAGKPSPGFFLEGFEDELKGP